MDTAAVQRFRQFLARRGVQNRSDEEIAGALEKRGQPLLLATGAGENSRITCDLDGTLAEKMEPFDPSKVGPPRKGAQEFVRQLKKLAKEVPILTAREHLEPVKLWVKANGFPVDGVTNRKLPALFHVDDHGVRAEGDLMGNVLPTIQRLMRKPTHLATGGTWERLDLSLADVLKHPLHSLISGYQSLLERLRDEPETPEEDRPPASAIDRYLGGEWMEMVSSNVAGARYLPDEEALEIEYLDKGHGTAFYKYMEISLEEARSFAEAGSPGAWIWDNLRVRKTVYGHRKSYVFISGISAYEPKWMRSAETRRRHGTIGPGGT